MPIVSETRSELPILVPQGYLATRQYLLGRGASAHSLDNLLKSGQLVAPVQGVYRRPDTHPTWQMVVWSLQRMGSDLVVGGLTALGLHGLAHYLPMSADETIHLYGHDPLPDWVNRLGLKNRLVHHSLARLMTPEVGNKLYTAQFGSGGNKAFQISSPERAILEVLAEVPEQVSFEHADELMQGLTTLSPNRLDALLRETRSVKVKRLFFWLAERQGHAWLKKLDLKSYDLGSGKRVLVKGGKLDKTYQITVPEEMLG